MHFFLSIYFNNHPVRVSSRLTTHLQEAVTVFAAYGIYHAEYILKLCKITCIYGVRGSTAVKVLCYKSEGRWFDPNWCHWKFSLR